MSFTTGVAETEGARDVPACEVHTWDEILPNLGWNVCTTCGVLGERDPAQPNSEVVALVCEACGEPARWVNNDNKRVCTKHYDFKG